MQAVQVREVGVIGLAELAPPAAEGDDVVVHLRAAGVNRRDVWVRRGVYPFPLPLTPGSDGAGVRADTGEEVVILPSLHWGPDEDAPGVDFQILGGPRDGTYAEQVAVPASNLFPKPPHLSWAEAAAFPLAGVTAHRALFARGGLRAGQTVLILGAGSGVSTFAVQLAHLAGATVIVTSSSAEKIARATQLGAVAGVNYRHPEWTSEVEALGPIDLVVDSVGVTIPDSLKLVRPGGRVVVFGATGGEEVEIAIRPLYLGQKSILGTTMGSPRDFTALLSMMGDVVPAVDSVFPLAEASTALERLDDPEHFGKVVLEIDP